MGIDARIPLGVQPLQLQMPSPDAGMNQLARVMQLQGMQDERAARQSALAKDNALSTLMSDPTFDLSKPESQRKLYATAPGRAGAILKSHADVQNANLTGEKTRYELAEKGYTAFRQTGAALFNEPQLSKPLAMDRLGRLAAAGLIRPEVLESMTQTMPEDPEQLRTFVRSLVTEQLPAEKMLTVFAPSPEKIDNGQQISFRDKNPLSPTYGQETGGAPVQKVMTPGEVATDKRTREEGAANRGVTLRGQNLADARARETLTAGKAPAGYRYKPDGTLEAIPGGPADIKAGEAGAKRSAAFDTVRDSIAVLDKAIDHPGREGSTGLSVLNPLSYIPGRDTTNFRAVLGQIKGKAFLQAFESLKGGGQITQIEGEKATNAITRMDRAQSDDEFLVALMELRDIMNRGYERLGGKRIPRPDGKGTTPGDRTSGGAVTDAPAGRPAVIDFKDL